MSASYSESMSTGDPQAIAVRKVNSMDVGDTFFGRSLINAFQGAKSFWNSARDEGFDFDLFHRMWWGEHSEGKKKLDAAGGQIDRSSPNRLLEISLTRELMNLSESNGIVYIRIEYEKMYERLEKASKLKNGRVVVTGQPGIGKSYFLMYVLLLRFTQGKATLFTTADGRTFKFDESGVWTMNKADVETRHLPKSEDPTTLMWSLIDANRSGDPETSNLGHSDMVFAILAASPHPQRLKLWVREHNTVTRIMDPWEIEESLFLFSRPELTTLPDTTRNVYQSREAVEELVSQAGPCPRDMIFCAKKPTTFDKAIDKQIKLLRNISDVRAILESAAEGSEESEQNSASHRLVLIRRGFPDAFGWEDDTTHVAFKSPDIMRRLVLHHAALADASVKDLFVGAKSYSASLAGVVFETLALRYTSGAPLGDTASVFHSFCQMVLNPTEKSLKRFSHIYSKEGSIARTNHTVTVKENRSIEYAPIPRTEGAHAIMATNTVQLPVSGRVLLHYDNVETVDLPDELDHYYYIPKQPNNPFFDSFFLESSQTKVTVWVFQMAIARTHGASAAGFERLAKLQQRLLELRRSVVFRYVLVAPIGKVATYQTIHWHMPQWVEADQVFVQYLRLAPMEIEYKDLFGLTR